MAVLEGDHKKVMKKVRIGVLGVGRGAGLAEVGAAGSSKTRGALYDMSEALQAKASATMGVQATYTPSYEGSSRFGRGCGAGGVTDAAARRKHAVQAMRAEQARAEREHRGEDDGGGRARARKAVEATGKIYMLYAEKPLLHHHLFRSWRLYSAGELGEFLAMGVGDVHPVSVDEKIRLSPTWGSLAQLPPPPLSCTHAMVG